MNWLTAVGAEGVVLADLPVHGRLRAEGVEDRVDRIRVSGLRSVVALHLDENAVIGADIVIHVQAPYILLGEIPRVGAELQGARYAGRERMGVPQPPPGTGVARFAPGAPAYRLKMFW